MTNIAKLMTTCAALLVFAGAVVHSARRGSAEGAGATVAAGVAGVAGVIDGRVVDTSGYPAAARITVTPAQGGRSMYAVARADGTFKVEGLVEGIYRLDFELQGYDLTRRNHVRVTADSTTSVQAEIRVSGLCECVVSGLRTAARIQGRVLDSLGRPLPHARLSLAHPGWVESTYADADGTFIAHRPAKGTFHVTASDSGFTTARHPLSTTTTGVMTLVLRPTGPGDVPDVERLVHGCGCPDLISVDGR